ncbi:NAD-dependent epimerase/dehydratase family protein [Schumannella soli]|uniref:NAD-dependent epimerase/dehydratase family protein n=1 Tax=Schumannella soli TaxID=2590779 RepID=UPI001C63F85C|nr:NAD-dependent epimerase/dehydratase family protein [Schumannella soli]
MPQRILVTGGSGYIGGWCVLAALRAGYDVRTTVRDLRKGEVLRGQLHHAESFDDARVLTASRDAGVKRVVLTSASGAIVYGHPKRSEPFTEADWTAVDNPDVAPYQRSKTLAERAAWAFIAEDGGGARAGGRESDRGDRTAARQR